MTTRSDVTVDFQRSPRTAEVASPSTSLTMQDTIDTLRKIEDGFSTGLAFDKLVNASGKDDLGGGVFVGITVSLQNLKVAFEPRRTPAESGTVTTASGTPIETIHGGEITFVDTAADFVTANIEPGSLVINFTDQSIADVVRVDSSDTLTTRILANGADNTYQVGDVYQVFNIVQCELFGGNLVAVDDNDSTIPAVLPTAFTQIVRTSSSSATLQEQVDIQYASFNGGVSVDVTSPYSGTTYPVGTPRQPVNNLSDAIAIAVERGFITLYIYGDITIGGGLDVHGYVFIGESQNKTHLTIDTSANVTHSEFETATIAGTLDGGNSLKDCAIVDLDFVDGQIQQCLLLGEVVLSGVDEAHFLDCWSGKAGSTTPSINLGGTGSALSLRNYNGGILLKNKTGTDAVSIDLNSGQIIIDNTITGGEIVLRGVGKWANKDTYTGGATIINELLNPSEIVSTLDANVYDGKAFSNLLIDLLAMANGRMVEDPPGSGIIKIYAQDNTTVRYTLTKVGNERSRS